MRSAGRVGLRRSAGAGRAAGRSRYSQPLPVPVRCVCFVRFDFSVFLKGRGGNGLRVRFLTRLDRWVGRVAGSCSCHRSVGFGLPYYRLLGFFLDPILLLLLPPLLRDQTAGSKSTGPSVYDRYEDPRTTEACAFVPGNRIKAS